MTSRPLGLVQRTTVSAAEGSMTNREGVQTPTPRLGLDAGDSDGGVAMPLLDQVRKLEQEVVDRLKALEPLLREYDQLRRVAERLGLKYTPPAVQPEGESEPATRQGTRRPGRARAGKKAAAKPRAASSTTARGSTAATATSPSARGTGSRAKRSGPRAARSDARAGAGQRREQVLAVVGEHPGITVREIGERLRVGAPPPFPPVEALARRGHAAAG